LIENRDRVGCAREQRRSKGETHGAGAVDGKIVAAVVLEREARAQ